MGRLPVVALQTEILRRRRHEEALAVPTMGVVAIKTLSLDVRLVAEFTYVGTRMT